MDEFIVDYMSLAAERETLEAFNRWSREGGKMRTAYMIMICRNDWIHQHETLSPPVLGFTTDELRDIAFEMAGGQEALNRFAYAEADQDYKIPIYVHNEGKNEN